MWTGGSSGTGDGFPQPWAHGSGPAASYMTMPPEQVDWASLAQQWIKMKESTADPSKEGGEAPMEITKDDQTGGRNPEWPPGQDGAWNAGNWAWEQGGGAWMNWAAAAVPKAPVVPAFPTAGYTTIPEPPAPHIPPAPIYSYVPTQTVPSTNATAAASPDFTRDYWPSNAATDTKHSLVEPNHTRKRNSSSSSVEPPPELDAAKRKKLPAWIREGLEKMEREKQKRAEQERLDRLKQEEKEIRVRTPEPPVISMGEPLNGPSELMKSKFESDSDSSSDSSVVVENDSKPPEEEPTKRWSRFDSNEPPSQSTPAQLPHRPAVKSHRSKDQILQAVMTDVRRVITHILLEVTNEEIEKAVEEVDRKLKKKAPATTIRKTPALTSLTGKLGLGVYESDSGSDSDSEKVTNEPDSDEEIQERIARLKNEFVSVEILIEREAHEQEEREKRQLIKSVPRGGDESQSDAEEQVQPQDEGVQMKFTGAVHASKESFEKDRHNFEVHDTHRDSSAKNHDHSNSKSKNSRHSSSTSSSTTSSSTSSTSSSSSTSVESTSRKTTTRPSSSSSKRRSYHRGGGGDRSSSRYSRSKSRSWSRSSRTRSRSRSRDRRSHKRKVSTSRKRRRRSSDRRRRRSSSSSSGGRYSSGRRSGHRR